MLKLLLILALIAMLKCTADAARVTQGGKTSWRIVVPGSSGDVERFACDELKRYVKQMSGAALLDARNERSHVIRIGLRKDLGTIDLPAAKTGFDGYSITVTDDAITIAGDNPRGVLYAVYDLLERLGCRWYHPTIDPKDPEVVPKNADLLLPNGKWSESARIEDRLYWISGLAFKVMPESIAQLDWAAKNRYNGLSWQCIPDLIEAHLAEMESTGVFAAMRKRGMMFHGPGHSFPHFLPTKTYFDKHPQWFGFREGKRQPHGDKWPLTNFCMSNVEAQDEFIRNVLEFAKQHPQIQRLDLLPIDGGLPCECENCLKSTPTDLLIALYNKLATRLKTAAPDVVLDCVPGYGQLTETPDKVFPSDGLAGLYAHWGRNHAESYDDPQYGRRPNLMVWESYFKRFMICSYYAANSHQPFTGPPYLHAIEGDTRYMVNHGVSGALVLEYPFGFWWSNSFNVRMGGLYPYYYPKRDPVSELNDYALRYYGPKAGPIMGEYLAMAGATENLERTYRASRAEADEGDVAWLKDMRSMIGRAAQLAEGDQIYSYRISKAASAMDMLIRLAPCGQKISEIDKAVAEIKDGKAQKADAETKIAAARAMIADLISYSDKLGALNNGVVDPEWMKGWTINRILTDPLDRAEKSLNANGKTD
jgi:hypothetical protein